MKTLRSGLELKKSIIKLLKEKPHSLRRLDIKLNTSSKTILMHCRELEFLGIVEITKTIEGSRNGRPFMLVKLTENGQKLKV